MENIRRIEDVPGEDHRILVQTDLRIIENIAVVEDVHVYLVFEERPRGITGFGGRNEKELLSRSYVKLVGRDHPAVPRTIVHHTRIE